MENRAVLTKPSMAIICDSMLATDVWLCLETKILADSVHVSFTFYEIEPKYCEAT